MKFTEMILNNFGKFTEKKILLSDGINLIYGENESGKTTLHTFLKGMLYGLERGRGRASQNDTFSMYEPWDKSNYYSGVLRFSCGGRNFRLERNFDRYSKKAILFCEDDGEELSIAHGDLEMLLGKMDESEYENTIAIGQMKIATGSTLAAGLKNYAANYYATGNGEINLDAAETALKNRKRDLEREVKEAELEKQRKRERIELEASYVWRDIHHMEKELDQVREEQEQFRKRKKEMVEEHSKQAGIEEQAGMFDKWRSHPLELFSMIAAFVLSFVLFGRPWKFLVAVVVALAEGLYIWNCMKDGKKKLDENKEEQEAAEHEINAGLQKADWRTEELLEDYREKKVQYSNLQEQLEELDEVSTVFKEQEVQRQALDLALKTIEDLSGEMQNWLGEQMDREISEIVSQITGGKYEKLWTDDALNIQLLSSGHKIRMEQVSRGTAEQIYFALRMAAANILQEEKCPVILDDTFAYYDDNRLKQTLKWLSRQQRQVLIFTCQKREEEMLRQMGLEYSRVEI